MLVIRDVRTHIRRSPYQALAAMLTMFITFLVGGVFFLASLTSASVLSHFEKKPQITVFFAAEAGKAEADALKSKLTATGKVSGTHFVSKEEALAIYQKQNQSDPLLLEMVTAEILPASLEISATDPVHLSELASIIQGGEGVDEVVYQRDVVDSLLSWTNAIRLAGGVLGLLLALDSLLIIGTVIAMKIALKREEIQILTLVGASPWAIRAPFIVEGGIYGFIGASCASLTLVAMTIWLRQYLLSFLSTIPSIQTILGNPVGTPFIVSALIFVVGTQVLGFWLGAFGSSMALRRYLK